MGADDGTDEIEVLALLLLTQVPPGSQFGAYHSAEIAYVFDNLHRNQRRGPKKTSGWQRRCRPTG